MSREIIWNLAALAFAAKEGSLVLRERKKSMFFF